MQFVFRSSNRHSNAPLFFQKSDISGFITARQRHKHDFSLVPLKRINRGNIGRHPFIEFPILQTAVVQNPLQITANEMRLTRIRRNHADVFRRNSLAFDFIQNPFRDELGFLRIFLGSSFGAFRGFKMFCIVPANNAFIPVRQWFSSGFQFSFVPFCRSRALSCSSRLSAETKNKVARKMKGTRRDALLTTPPLRGLVYSRDLHPRFTRCKSSNPGSHPSAMRSMAKNHCPLLGGVGFLLVHAEGFEPTTTGSEDQCSIQLSYACSRI